jgi:hypothetical protein
MLLMADTNGYEELTSNNYDEIIILLGGNSASVPLHSLQIPRNISGKSARLLR